MEFGAEGEHRQRDNAAGRKRVGDSSPPRISRSLSYSWRREAMARSGGAPGLPELVPVLIAGGASEPAAADERRKPAARAAGTIEIALRGAVRVRVCGKVEEHMLQAVLAALRSA